MPPPSPSDLEDFWAEVLSGVPERVRAAAAGLDSDERVSLVAHLEAMASRVGWNEGQRRRARQALEALRASSLKP